MDVSNQSKHRIEVISQDSISQFEKIARAARQALTEFAVAGSSAFAAINTLTNAAAVERISTISRENRASYHALTLEPAIARVVAIDRDGKQRVYFICRAAPVSGVANLASYRAPIGRLASLPIGSELSLRDGTKLEVVEQAKLHPFSADGAWDSRDSVIEADDHDPITVVSLRAVIEALSRPPEDLLGQLLASEEQNANVIRGIRRSVITKMELRDQPILDQLQDGIFRLPLDSRLVLLGPPGTGKTTTLIRRLGQKLDTDALNDNEQRLVSAADMQGRTAHASSWLMFTPTDLLRQYLKEAFAREGVPASDLHIKTWSDFRRELGRNTFGILRSGTGRGSFVLKEAAETLTEKALRDPVGWASEFDSWQRTTLLSQLRNSALHLGEHNDAAAQTAGQRLSQVLGTADGRFLGGVFRALTDQAPGLRALSNSLKEVTDRRLQGALNLQLNRSKTFIDEFGVFLSSLDASSELETDAEDSEESDAEDEQPTAARTPRLTAVAAYLRVLRAYARACATGRTLGTETRNGRIITWLGDRVIHSAQAAEVGASLLVQGSVRRFVNPVARYLEGIPRRYRAFRRETGSDWYRKVGLAPSDLNPLELDVLLFTILRSARELMDVAIGTPNLSVADSSALNSTVSLYRNQIVVDEVTDFSPVQIACMAALTNPTTRSFFACGDLNQRLTTWGTRSVAEMLWSDPGMEVREINICYRQSRQLNELSRAIIEAVGGTDPGTTLPPHVDNEGVPAALLEGAPDLSTIVEWLAGRIREIEETIRQLPSIAVFVDGESAVQPLAAGLGNRLAEHNTRVTACPNGQVIGQEGDVRVFDVQHIKGLEFEAVFFVGVDRLADAHPDLFDKYLYVGATRAATYLGVTCNVALPRALSALRGKFVADWAVPTSSAVAMETNSIA